MMNWNTYKGNSNYLTKLRKIQSIINHIASSVSANVKVRKWMNPQQEKSFQRNYEPEKVLQNEDMNRIISNYTPLKELPLFNGDLSE